MLPMAGRTAGPIKTKLGLGTHVDPGSVLVKVKVMWCHLVNANETLDRGPQGPREFEAQSTINTPYRGPQGRDNRSSVKHDKSPSGGRVLTAS